jgi:hypothetical protein
MRHAFQYFAACVCLCCFSSFAAAEDFYSQFLSQVGTNYSGADYSVYFWPGEEVHAPLLTDTNNTAPKLTKSKLSDLGLRPILAIAGINLGMTMDQVVSVWGKPRAVSLYHNGARRLSYRDSIYPDQPYATADVLFHPGSNSVMAIWVVFWKEHGKPLLSPTVDECLRALGEPLARNYIPEPLEPRQEPPKHWYCRMVYKQPPLVLYFSDGRLMALEANPRSKGVAPENEGTDDYSIGFCLE